MAAVSFPKFGLLPPELRLKIWRAAREPRIVEGTWSSGKSWQFKTYLPPLFTINKESNEIGSKFYSSDERLILPETTLVANAPNAPLSDVIWPRCTALFHHEEDVLYIPYQSKCSMSYGFAVDKFLARVQTPMKIRHLALSLPLTRTNVTSMDSSSQKTKDDLQKIVNFFKVVQSKGRMRVPLKLETLTLVLGDPVMLIDGHAKHEVRAFSEVEIRDDSNLIKMLTKAVRDCKNSLKAPHSLIDRTSYPQARRTTRNSWGTPEIRFRIIERAESDNMPDGWSGA